MTPAGFAALSLAVVTLLAQGASADQSPVALLSSSETGITLRYEAGEIRVESFEHDGRSYSKVIDAGTVPSGIPGAPELPVVRVKVAVPDCREVDLSITTGSSRREEGVRVAPSPGYVRDPSSELDIIDYVYREGTVYEEDALWPDRPASVYGPTWWATQRIVEVEFHPVQTNPVSGTLLLHEEIEVTLTFAGVRRPETPLRDSPRREQLFRSALLNYESGRAWRSKPTGQGRRQGDYFTTSANWARLTVSDFGMHRITSADLLEAGIAPGAIDPQTIRIFSGGGLPVPVHVTAPRPDWMEECTIHVRGEEDGQFNDGDFVAFYALAVDGWADHFGVEAGEQPYRENAYATHSVYWLTWEELGVGSAFAEPPARMEEDDLQEVPDPTAVGDYWERDHFERNVYANEGVSDGWFWIRMIQPAGFPETVYMRETLDHTLGDPNGLLRMRLEGMSSVASVNPDHLAISSVNGTEAYEAVWDGYEQIVFETRGVSVVDGTNEISVYAPRPEGTDRIYIDWFDLEYWRHLEARSSRLGFGSSGRTGTLEYSVEGLVDDDIDVYKVLDKYTVRTVPGVSSETGDRDFTAVFQDEVADTASYLVASASGYLSPIIEADAFGDLRSPPDPDYVMVVYDGFYDQATRLKNLRESQEGGGFRVWLVRVSDVYDEFSWGLTDHTAIRDFLKHTYDNSSVGPTHALLIGDASIDHRNYTGSSVQDFVPTHYTLRRLYEEPEFWPTEQWFAAFDDTTVYIPAMALGRLSARSSSELSTLIDKIEGYETEAQIGLWKNDVILVGDDECKGLDCEHVETFHVTQTEEISDDVLPWPLDRTKIYLMEYDRDAAGMKPAARADLLEAWNGGALIMNFTGHGNEIVLAHESVFLFEDISLLLNIDALPLFIAASCRLNKFDIRTVDSLGENLVKSAIGGAIASLGSTRDSFAGSNAILNRNFLKSMFGHQQDSPAVVLDIGTSLQAAFDLGSWTNNTRFAIIGDPALKLAGPRGAGQIEPQGVTPMKRRDIVSVSGANEGATAGLDGIAWLRVSESADTSGYTSPFTTPPRHVEYTLPGETIFEGPLSVADGSFAGEFVVSSRAEEGPYGRVRAYFYNDEIDGSCSLENVVIADSVDVADNSGPIIGLEFEGGITSVTTGAELAITISDPYGVNTIARESDDGIVLTIDGGALTTDLTASFSNDLDSHESGTLKYSVPSLSLGGHTISVAASDNVGNRSEESIWFEIVSEAEFKIRNVANFPNPFPDGADDGTTILFWLPEESDVRVEIFTVGGRIIRIIDDIHGASGANEVYWDGLDEQRDELSNGVYLYRISATSLEYRGRKAEAIGKAVVMR